MLEDTIAAPATAYSNNGISIIRVSGGEALGIVNRIFKSKKGKSVLMNIKTHSLMYGYIYDGESIVDEVLVSYMKAPKSYTAEDVVEINCHGGIVVTNKILSLLLNNGARIAEPGEFTKRAFLNGRIDLSQAESVIDIINAKSELALKNSISQLKGNLYIKIKEIRDSILHEAAYIEAALDDPEHISLDGYTDHLYEKIVENRLKLEKLLKSTEEGRIINEGIKTVILGRPNVGKSSLMNYMAGEEKAIVTEIAGTTRDVIRENITIEGIYINIIDTAGIRETNDVIEKIGIEKAMKVAKEADLILYIIDSSIPLDENDENIIVSIKEKNAIILLNKSDLQNQVNESFIKDKTNKKVIRVSIKDGIGIDILYKSIKEMYLKGNINFNDEVYISNMRHKEALLDAVESFIRLEESIDNGMSEDIYTIDMVECCDALGKITGESINEDLINTIFDKFCMGK